MILTDILSRFTRVINMATKPDTEEIIEIIKISLVGMIAIGIFGSAISLLFSSI